MTARNPDRDAPAATVAALVGHARRALAATGGGTLLINGQPAGAGGAGRASRPEADVLLYDEDGEPRFLCEAGSAVACAAGRGRDAVLEVSCCRRSGCRREVSFAGRLSLLDTDDVDGVPVHVVGLVLSAVTVRQAGSAGVELPLADYRNPAVGDVADVPGSESLAAYAERVVRHTNHSHGGALRGAAAGLAGAVPGAVLAAELADLTDQGFALHWIDGDGAHSSPVSFPRVARSPGDLAVLLHGALTP